jgi:hypothetical protein
MTVESIESFVFKLNISYSQICVFDSSLLSPFNDWTDLHVRQGFSWRPGSVSFRTLEEAGSIEVYVEIKNQLVLKEETIRAIRVPFRVSENRAIEVASIGESSQLDINPGDYSLVFETGFNKNSSTWCSFSFLKGSSTEAEILKADEELNPPSILLMTSESA